MMVSFICNLQLSPCAGHLFTILYCSLVPQAPGELALPQIKIDEVEDSNEGPSLSAERKNININQYTLTSEDNLALYEVCCIR